MATKRNVVAAAGCHHVYDDKRSYSAVVCGHFSYLFNPLRASRPLIHSAYPTRPAHPSHITYTALMHKNETTKVIGYGGVGERNFNPQVALGCAAGGWALNGHIIIRLHLHGRVQVECSGSQLPRHVV